MHSSVFKGLVKRVEVKLEVVHDIDVVAAIDHDVFHPLHGSGDEGFLQSIASWERQKSSKVHDRPARQEEQCGQHDEGHVKCLEGLGSVRGGDRHDWIECAHMVTLKGGDSGVILV